jgi:hypothetical protein
VNPLLVIDETNADEAYERILPEAMKLDGNALNVINVDPTNTILITMAVAKRLPGLEGELLTLTQFPSGILPKFADYVLAFYSAQTRYTFATAPLEELPELLAKASNWRDILHAEAKSLATRGRLNGDLLKELTGTHGYRNVAMDLAGLARIFKSTWATIDPYTGLTKEEIAEVDKLALKMTGAVAQREQSPERAAEATNIRLRMFTLLSNAYEEIRRAVQFLRWHDEDADVIAPSLYSGRQNSTNGKKHNSETKPADTEPMTTPIASQFAPPTSTSKTAVGMPNCDPFGG